MKRLGPGELAPNVGRPDEKPDNAPHFDSIFCVHAPVRNQDFVCTHQLEIKILTNFGRALTIIHC